MSPDRLVRVRFSLEQEDGWPPYESEGLWATPLGRRRYRIENTPWFVRGLANGDVVRARTDEDGVLWASDILEASGWLTVRIIPRADGPFSQRLDLVLDQFVRDGVGGEGMAQNNIVALEIAPTVDVSPIKARLIAGQNAGEWDFEEGAVSKAWRTA